MVQIENTISFAYPNGSAKPSMDEMAKFVKSLDANLADMDTMYRIAEEKSVFLKFKTEAGMRYAIMHNPEQLTFRYDNGKAVEVRMSVADGNVQYVRIFDLPPEVPDADISSVLGRYGEVKRVVREKYPAELGLDMFTGVRGVYVDVEKDIPSALNFRDRKGNIFYAGNRNKCFLCKAEGHQVNSCPKRKVRKQHQQQQQNDVDRKQNSQKRKQDEDLSATSSYADVVADGASAESIEEFDEEVMAIDEIVSETENDGNEEQSSGNQVQPEQRVKWDYRKNPAYIKAQAIFDEHQRKKQEMQNEKKKKLQTRETTSTKQSSSRNK